MFRSRDARGILGIQFRGPAQVRHGFIHIAFSQPLLFRFSRAPTRFWRTSGI